MKELLLQTVENDQKQFLGESLQLELALTEYALGHEYKLMELDGKPPSFWKKETLMEELENLKVAYFQTRARMHEIAPERLFAVEEQIKLQKDILREDKICLQ